MTHPSTRVVLAGLMTIVLAADARADERPLAHIVYFKLKDDSADAGKKLVASCHKHLSDHEGTVYFSVGVLAGDLKREVNDRDFDVALHLVFVDKAAHDKYQTHPRHLKFIAENKEALETVRVFDSYLAQGASGVPAAAREFAGMVRGKVVAKKDGIVLAVTKVPRVWRTNRAEDPEALLGKRIRVTAGKAEPHRRFLETLEVGEEVTLDVAHRGTGNGLRILELTRDQRERAKP